MKKETVATVGLSGALIGFVAGVWVGGLDSSHDQQGQNDQQAYAYAVPQNGEISMLAIGEDGEVCVLETRGRLGQVVQVRLGRDKPHVVFAHKGQDQAYINESESGACKLAEDRPTYYIAPDLDGPTTQVPIR